MAKPENFMESSESEEVEETSSEELSDSEPEFTQKAQPQRLPSPSSSDDDEDSGSESESESDGPDSNVATKPEPQQTTAKLNSVASEDSGSESDSDSDGPDSNTNKPIATKPINGEPPKTSSATLKSIASEPATGKRPAEEKEMEGTDAKKAKKSEPESSNIIKSNDDSKKLLFQRIWSEDDEIVMLKGMIDYATKKKSDPIADLNAFHGFIKENLHVEVTKVQLQDKIRRLKKKYENNKNKEKEGKDRTFSKSHEQMAYDLSKKIWGNENGSPKSNGGSTVKKTTTTKANAEEVKDVESVEALNGIIAEHVPSASRLNFNGGGVEENILRIGAELFAAGKGTEEAKKEWEKLKWEEIKVFHRQLQLKTARVKLVLDCLKSTDD